VDVKAADRLAAQLELDVDDVAICHACLSFVSMAIDGGDEAQIKRQTRRIAPDLWEEGLAQPVRLALGRARERRVAGADEALADVEARGARGVVVRAIVRRLGAQLGERAQGDLLRMGFKPWPPR
jgi:hypothetical protein